MRQSLTPEEKEHEPRCPNCDYSIKGRHRFENGSMLCFNCGHEEGAINDLDPVAIRARAIFKQGLEPKRL